MLSLFYRYYMKVTQCTVFVLQILHEGNSLYCVCFTGIT